MYKLSPTGLSDFQKCPRCFWLAKTKNLSYRGIFPSLPEGIDRCLKNYFDQLRDMDKDRIFPFQEDLRLYPDQDKLDIWRAFPKGGLRYVSGDVEFFGYIDDLLILEKGKTTLHIPFDFKTKKEPPFDGYGEKYYNLQISSYEYLLQKNKMKTAGYGYLAFVSPLEMMGMGDDMRSIASSWDITWQKINSDVPKVARLIEEATDCLKSATMPHAGAGCSMCDYFRTRRDSNDGK